MWSCCSVVDLIRIQSDSKLLAGSGIKRFKFTLKIPEKNSCRIRIGIRSHFKSRIRIRIRKKSVRIHNTACLRKWYCCPRTVPNCRKGGGDRVEGQSGQVERRMRGLDEGGDSPYHLLLSSSLGLIHLVLLVWKDTWKCTGSSQIRHQDKKNHGAVEILFGILNPLRTHIFSCDWSRKSPPDQVLFATTNIAKNI